MTSNAAKVLMTEAALATLRGDVDAVARTEAALAGLDERGSKDPQPQAPLQASASKCPHASAMFEVVSREVRA